MQCPGFVGRQVWLSPPKELFSSGIFSGAEENSRWRDVSKMKRVKCHFGGLFTVNLVHSLFSLYNEIKFLIEYVAQKLELSVYTLYNFIIYWTIFKLISLSESGENL